MIFRIVFISIVIFAFSTAVFGQVDSLIGQVTDSPAEVFAGGISGDGRFIVFESRGNIATENPRNEDGNREIFLFDYAQRRIFQITDTKAVLFDTTKSALLFTNIRIEIANVRPVISSDGRWIAFSSNATSATPTVPNATNPGSFDGNTLTATPTPTPVPSPSVTPTPNPTATPTPTPAVSPTPTPTPLANPLTADANLEMWIYQIPPYAPVADLSSGDEIALANLTGGTFTLITNTPPSQFPRPATSTNGAFVADDNHDASINDDGTVIAFASTRDLVKCVGNMMNPSPPYEDNDEIFTYVRGNPTQCGVEDPLGISAGIRQVTKTLRGPISNPIYNKNPTISGNGRRVVFTSTGDDPIDNPNDTANFNTGSNPLSSRNEEIFFTDLAADGRPGPGPTTDLRLQITTTTPTNPGDPVNILDLGKRMSRDGKYIAFDSYGDLATTPQGANKTSFALYLYDVDANATRQIGPRSDADTAATGGDANHYPTFTSDDITGDPLLVLETRLNIKPDGTIPTTASDGLNNIEGRPTQLYSFPLTGATPLFTRLTKFPVGSVFASTQAIPSNTIKRFAFNLASTELGTGNSDGFSEVYYFVKPTVTTAGTARGFEYYTGATHQLAVRALPSPTPTPTATPTPSPSPSVSPTPTPTPVTPASVQGLSPGMLASVEFDRPRPIPSRTAVSSIKRTPGLPYELGGVTMTINGVACLLKSTGPNKIEFVTPRFLSSASTGTNYPIVINSNGNQYKGTINIVPTRPDIFNTTMAPVPGGRTKLFNVTNRVFTTEPFSIRTIRRRGNVLTPSVLRITLTGVANVDAPLVTIRIRDGDKTMTGIASTNILVEPGVYTVDFPLNTGLEAAGDQLPVVVTVTVGGVTFSSRLDDTTSKVSIL